MDRRRPRDPIRVRVTDPTPTPHFRVSTFPILSEAQFLCTHRDPSHDCYRLGCRPCFVVPKCESRLAPPSCLRFEECSCSTPMGDPFRDLSQEDPLNPSLQSFESGLPTFRLAAGPQGSSQFTRGGGMHAHSYARRARVMCVNKGVYARRPRASPGFGTRGG